MRRRVAFNYSRDRVVVIQHGLGERSLAFTCGGRPQNPRLRLQLMSDPIGACAGSRALVALANGQLKEFSGADKWANESLIG